jgi:hypothetical protein
MLLGSCVVAPSDIPSTMLRLSGGLSGHLLRCLLDGRSTKLVDGSWEGKLVDALLEDLGRDASWMGARQYCWITLVGWIMNLVGS